MGFLLLAVAQLTLVVDHGGGPQALPLASEVAGPSFRAQLRESSGDYTLEIDYTKPVYVRSEDLVFELPAADGARVIGRDAELHDAPPLLHVDTWTPKWVEVRTSGHTTIVDGGEETEAMTVERRGAIVRVTLELDNTDDHPFRAESRCRKSWRGGAAYQYHSTRYRAAGEVATYHFRIAEVAPNPLPLVKQRFPDGARAALSITDHADQSSFETLRALLYGASDERSPRYGKGGLLGHHLRLTKALFFDSAKVAKPQLDDPRMRKLAVELAQAGSEVIPHSATPRPDTREMTERALRFFQDLAAHNWIDHQPETNCEAFTDRGWRAGDRFYIADLLLQYGYRYVWSGQDPLPEPGNLNMLLPDHPELRRPWLYAHGPDGPGAPRLLLWSSVWMYLDAARFYAALSPQNLDRLEDERGIHVAHTYLESLHAHGRYRPRHVLWQDHGVVETTPEFEALLGELEMRQLRGTLFIAPIGAIADHLVDMKKIEVRYRDDGAVVLRNSGKDVVHGATFTAPCEVTLDGVPPVHARSETDGYTFWLDLPPGVDVVVRMPGAQFVVPEPASPPLAR